MVGFWPLGFFFWLDDFNFDEDIPFTLQLFSDDVDGDDLIYTIEGGNNIATSVDGDTILFAPVEDFNGIESVFSIFKNKLKRERLKAIVNERNINYKTKAIELFNEIDVLKINECINFSLNKLFSNW